jgi:hypothetical protein
MSNAPTITLTYEQASRMCFDKIAYRTNKRAGEAIKWMKRRMESQGQRFDPQRIYHCPVCGQFHTTSRREMDVPQVG